MNKLNTQKILLISWLSTPLLLCYLFSIPQYAEAGPIALVGTTTASGTNAAYNMSLTSLTGGIGSAPIQNDVVIVVNAFTSIADGNPGVGTAGYTEVADLYSSDTYDTNLSVNWKAMTSSPDTLVSCNPSGNAASSSVCMAYVWRGVDTTTPMDVADVEVSAANQSASDVNCGSITPVTTGAVVLCLGGATSAASHSSTFTWPATPAGMQGGTESAADAGGAMLAVGRYGYWTSGAYDPAAWVVTMLTEAQASWAADTIALRPSFNPPAVGQPRFLNLGTMLLLTGTMLIF